MTQLIATSGDLALFSNGSKAVIVDTTTNMAYDVRDINAYALETPWTPAESDASQEALTIAHLALTASAEPITGGSQRMYTIPGGVQAEAKKALRWRKEFKRGGTPVGLNSARTLARGGQIGIEKIRHIAKYFPRHEVDKRAKGWKPAQENYPSNGRIAWSLWGGDAAWRWASAIVEREDKKSLLAGGDYGYAPEMIDADYSSEINAFKVAHELDPFVGPEFMARVRLDGSGIDRLYKIEIDGTVYVWDDCAWDTLGHVDGDVYTYDKALDAPYDKVEKDHIIIDPSSAIIISAFMQERPFQPVTIDEIDPEESRMMADGLMDEDFGTLDMVLRAAGTADPVSNADKDGDGKLDPQFLSEKAENQPRDARGQFAAEGTRVVVAGDATRGKGVITDVDAKTGLVSVRLDNGKVIQVDAKYTEAEKGFKGARPVPADLPPLDLSGIIGESRTPINMPKAHLPGTLPPLSDRDIQNLINDFPQYVADMRKSYKPVDAADKARVKKDWGLEKFAGENSIVAAAEAEKQLTPKTSDVPAKYLAIVSPDDKEAVMDLVAIVPKTVTTTTPVLYERKDGEWVANDQILNDLKSATPPPVVELDDKAILNDVLVQMDEGLTASAELIKYWYNVIEPVLAAGGLDQNRGNAEELRRYWTRGKGAAKIRWGTPGDWKRCVRYLAKYMGPRAKGYCQLRHKDATGVYTGSKLNPGRDNSSDEFLMEEVWGENIGQPTEITEDDMLMPIEEIMSESDDLYDSTWEPEDAICKTMDELGKCSDDEFEALIAAGGFDRNRGNAEELRRYWTTGKGALKIRWGTPGDWTRCVRQLSKYMGPRAKGYCQLRHKDATGVYTGSRLNPGKDNSFAATMFSSLEEFETKMIEQSKLNARAKAAKERFSLTAAATPVAGQGAKFRIPLLIPEDLESGDGRKFNKESITLRELPLPLLWQIKTGEGHAGSVVVGRIDYVERTEQGMGNAYGVFDSGVYGQEAERLVRNGFLRGVSADLDQFEAKEEKKPRPEGATEFEDDQEIGKDKLTVNKARVMAATIVAKPAFQECTISIDDSGDQEEDMAPIDGVYEETIVSSVEPITASGFLDSEIPVVPPQDWFENPKLTKPTPLTVDPSGRIYGHIAAWHVNHIGMPRSTRPPRSRSKYAYFHTGVVRTDVGKDIPVGQLTLAGGHADLHASAAQAAKHYDDTASAIADVCAGEDDHGIWVSGSLRPDASEMQIRALRASAPSGDWRPINGALELVAVCQVNVPGFPIARALVASGKVMALVAAGASFMAILKSDTVTHFAAKAQELASLSASAPDLKSRVRAAKKSARQMALTAAATKAEDLRERALTAAAITELAKFTEEERKDLAEKGIALPDGSYPIRNEADLKNAIRAYGRSNPSDRAKVRTHIRKRAKALGKATLVPEEWKSAASMETADAVSRMRAAITAAMFVKVEPQVEEAQSDEVVKAAYLSLLASMATDKTAEFAELPEEISDEELKKLKDAKEEADKQTEEEIKLAEDVRTGKTTVEDKFDEKGRTKYTPETQPRDAKGKYRKVLARLKQDLGVAGLSRALKKVEEAENLDFAGDYASSARASSELLSMIDRLDTKALNPQALENVRLTAAELGKTIANLPLPFGKDASKLRFSDLPAGLKDLIDSMITRVEAKIGKKDADIATKSLKSYMSGADVYSQGEVQSEMSKLLRLLT